jgi:hypothetical protein
VASGSGTPSGCTLNGAPCDGGSSGGGSGGGGTGGGDGGGSGGGGTGGGLFSPYVDITMASPTLKDVANATGQKHFTLAFALADSTGCNPSWGGTIPLNDPRVIGEVNDLKSVGGDVTVATGGAMGPYLENTCGSSSALLAAYEKAHDAVGSNRIDVDVEASIPIAQVNTALEQLQRTRGTAVTYTLRVQGQDYGVDPFSVQILQDAASRGLNVTVNPMLMDFGYTGSWGDALVAAANATLGQMRQIWPGKSDADLKRMLGLTPMIGKNDTGPTTTQDVARQLLDYAQTNHVGYIGFWSVGRDNGGCPNGSVSPTCSGIAQSTYEFTDIFTAFTG